MKKQKYKLITNCDKVLNSLQKIQLEALKELDRICRKNDINYSLGGGTCLGRVRHGGFIPWDDDIDIDMTLENYEKFLEIAPKELDHNRFFLRCRATDKKHLRTNSRLEIKNTIISSTIWDKKNMESGIYIDIMCLTYLPNNKTLRKIVSSLLFYIRTIYNYKMFSKYPAKANPKLATIIVILSKIVPTSLLFWLEKKLRYCCKSKKTNWLLDDSLVHGNYGGFPSKGIDTYIDTYFEDIKVMDKEDPKTFLTTLYGENYMEWLPPYKRISNHNLTKLDFGIYKEKFDIPNDYQKYLIIDYTEEKLKRMQDMSLEMAKDVDNICKKYNLVYYVANLNAYLKLNNIENKSQYFREPFTIAMPRECYNKFCKLASQELDKKYFFQTTETDINYHNNYARLRLNYTYIRELNIPKILEDKYNTGFFINVVPLDNTSNDSIKRKKHINKIIFINNCIDLKWKHYNFRYFIRKNLKTKINMIYLLPFSLKHLEKKLQKLCNLYSQVKTDYYIDSTGNLLDYKSIKKEILNNGKSLKYLGYEFVFPKNKDEYIKIVENSNYSNIRNESKLSKNDIDNLQRKFKMCFLNFYDNSEYQLSILRYDEKKKKYLSNTEILN